MFQAHPSLACDRDGRLWVAWDEAGPKWGKDYGFLYFKARRRRASTPNGRFACAVSSTANGKSRKRTFIASFPPT